MNKKIILSIVTPTYNRVKFLETTTSRSIKQIIDAGLEDEVEIIISNNASNDETALFIDEINGKYSFLTAFNQPNNLGVTKNIEWLVNKANGSHVLISSDDDLLEDGAIAYFVKSIKDKNPNFILINTSNIISTDDANKKYDVVLENRLKISKDIFVENFDRDKNLLKSTNNWLYLTNFITAVIFKKDLWQKEIETSKKYLDDNNVFLWQAPIIIGVKKYGRLFLIGKCFVLCRKNYNINYMNHPRGPYYINLYESIAVSKLIKDFMPEEYKKHKKLYAAFILSTFIAETHKNKNIRKFTLIALWRYIDCFPENIQFLMMFIFPKLLTNHTAALRNYKKAIFK